MLVPEEKKVEENGPKLVFVMFYALGFISHVPQQFYITANDYWMYKFRDPNNETFNISSAAPKTGLQANFTAYYSIVSSVTTVSVVILTFFIMKVVDVQRRIVGNLYAMIAFLIITLILVGTDTDSWQEGFFVISLLIGVVLNGAGACFMISTFELTIKFPPVYLGALLSGQAVCGIMVALIQIFTLAIGSSSQINAFIYFAIGAVLILAVQVLYVGFLVRNDYYKDRINRKEEEAVTTMKPIDRSGIVVVAKKVAPILITMVVSAGSAVMMHPGVTSLVESVAKGSGRWADAFFVPTCTFLTYNLFDFLGRECAIRWNLFGSTYVMMTVAILRLSLVPMIMFCNVQPRRHLEVIFNEDYDYLILIIVFSFTVGYLMNLCILQIQSVCEPEESKIATLLTVMVMFVSLALCSFLSRVLIGLI